MDWSENKRLKLNVGIADLYDNLSRVRCHRELDEHSFFFFLKVELVENSYSWWMHFNVHRKILPLIDFLCLAFHFTFIDDVLLKWKEINMWILNQKELFLRTLTIYTAIILLSCLSADILLSKFPDSSTVDSENKHWMRLILVLFSKGWFLCQQFNARLTVI